MKVIRFKDEGQDFLYWVVGDDNVVIESQPFQTSVWKGILILDQLDKVKKGDILNVSRESSGFIRSIKHPVESVEERPGVPADYTYDADPRNYMILFKGKPIGGAGIRDDAPAARGKVAAKNLEDNVRSAALTITHIILGREKRYDKILYQYLAESQAKAPGK